jgi:hypothetical protein
MAATGIRRRPFDLALAGFFSISVVYGLLVSLPEGLGVPVAPDSPWPPLRALHGWAAAQEPAHLDPPPALLASCLFDGLFQAPACAVIAYGLVRRRAWLRGPALFYAGAALTNMFYYFFQTFAGPHPPTQLSVYLPFNLPWLMAPMALAWRVRRAPLFGEDAPPAPARGAGGRASRSD